MPTSTLSCADCPGQTAEPAIERQENFNLVPFLRALPGVFVFDKPAGAVIFRQGDAADSVYCIVRGRVKLSVVSAQGREAVLGLLGNGHCFGEGCLTGQRTRTFKAEGLCDTVLVEAPVESMRRLLATDPEFSAYFLSFVIARNARIGEDLADHMLNRSEKRLARMLLLLANLDRSRLHNPRIGRISQETLAEMVGTTRSRVSFFMNKFRRLGFIRYRGEIEVDISLLNVVLGD